jgi:hypothetical protein
MRAKRVKLISGGGGGDDGDEAEFGEGQDDDEEEQEEDIQYKNVQQEVAADDDDEEVAEKNPQNNHKTLLELTHGINGETAKQRIESAVYQFAVGVMFVRKCLVASCGVSDTYTYDSELKQFYAHHPHLREELGPGHVPPGSSPGRGGGDANCDDDDDDMYIPQRK